MLMIRGLETRLRKLEAKRRPAEGLFYLVWGRDEAEVEAALARAEAEGGHSAQRSCRASPVAVASRHA